jgi:hypothetical protein
MRREMLDLGQAIDDGGHFLPELELDIPQSESGVLDHVVDQACDNSRGIEIQAGEDLGYGDAMEYVVLSRLPLLSAMGLLAEPVGTKQLLRINPLRKQIDREVPAGDYFTTRLQIPSCDADRHISIWRLDRVRKTGIQALEHFFRLFWVTNRLGDETMRVPFSSGADSIHS